MFNVSSSTCKCLLTNVSRTLCAMLLVVMLLPFTAVNAHTPYAQWDAYRVRHLQVLTTRSDLVGDAIADKWVAVLAEHLPKSKAVVSRARNFVRMASLLKTDQAKVAVLSYADAKAMFEGAAPFEDYAPMELQVLLDDGAYLLLTRADLPENHGFLVVSTLLEKGEDLNLTIPVEGVYGMEVHPGARAAQDEH